MKALELEGAVTWRRACATALDLMCCAVIIALPYLMGVVSFNALLPQPDRFWPDHLLEVLAFSPQILLVWPLWILAVGCIWHFSWIYFADGRTPGLRAGGLRVVDRYGDPLGSASCVVRVMGHILSALSLGLGWLWVLVGAERRSWADLLSRSYIIRY